MYKIIKVSMSTCVPCRYLAPIFKEIIQELSYLDNVEFEEVSDDHDYNRFEEIAVRYDVKGVPVVIITNEHGEEITRKTGLSSKESLLKFILETVKPQKQ